MSATDDRPLPGQLGFLGVPDIPPRFPPSPTVPIFLKDKTASWPEEDAHPGERQKVAPQVVTMTLAEALVKEHPGDEHFAAYAADLLMRLNTAIFDKSRIAAALNRRVFTDEKRAELLSYDWTVEMVAIVFDIDDPIAHERQTPARDEWRAAERPKVGVLLGAHPSAFLYETKGGYRIVYLLAQPFVIASLDDAERWKRHYKLTAASLVRRFGIIPDPSCADWTRCYRLPRVVRDGQREARPSIGDPRAIGALVYEPTEEDVATARALAEENGRWRIDHGGSAGPSQGTRREYDGEHRSAPAGGGLKWNLDGEPAQRAITLIAEHLPATGRHQLALALAGMLRREHATEADAAHILFESFRRGGSRDPKTRAAVVHHTWGLAADAPMLGFTTVAEILGEDAAKKIGDCFLSAYHDAFLGPSIRREPAKPNAALAPPSAPQSTSTPPPPPKKRKKLGPLGREIKKVVAKAKRSKNALTVLGGYIAERILDGEPIVHPTDPDNVRAMSVDCLVSLALDAIGFWLPTVMWSDVLGWLGGGIIPTEPSFTCSTERVQAAERAFNAGRERHAKWKAKNAAKKQAKKLAARKDALEKLEARMQERGLK